jgi:hypothetical protein
MHDLIRAAASRGSIIQLEPTEHCGIVWTSGDVEGTAVQVKLALARVAGRELGTGWTREGACCKCGQPLAPGAVAVQPSPETDK